MDMVGSLLSGEINICIFFPALANGCQQVHIQQWNDLVDLNLIKVGILNPLFFYFNELFSKVHITRKAIVTFIPYKGCLNSHETRFY